MLLCVTERDEAITEPSNHNVTSFTEVDKRVKRRLLMGNDFTPTFRDKQLGLCVGRDGGFEQPGITQGVKQGRGVMSSKLMHSSVSSANCEMTTHSPSVSSLKNMHL